MTAPKRGVIRSRRIAATASARHPPDGLLRNGQKIVPTGGRLPRLLFACSASTRDTRRNCATASPGVPKPQAARPPRAWRNRPARRRCVRTWQRRLARPRRREARATRAGRSLAIFRTSGTSPTAACPACPGRMSASARPARRLLVCAERLRSPRALSFARGPRSVTRAGRSPCLSWHTHAADALKQLRAFGRRLMNHIGRRVGDHGQRASLRGEKARHGVPLDVAVLARRQKAAASTPRDAVRWDRPANDRSSRLFNRVAGPGESRCRTGRQLARQRHLIGWLGGRPRNCDLRPLAGRVSEQVVAAGSVARRVPQSPRREAARGRKLSDCQLSLQPGWLARRWVRKSLRSLSNPEPARHAGDAGADCCGSADGIEVGTGLARNRQASTRPVAVARN